MESKMMDTAVAAAGRAVPALLYTRSAAEGRATSRLRYYLAASGAEALISVDEMSKTTETITGSTVGAADVRIVPEAR
jgi:hypothetical protein